MNMNQITLPVKDMQEATRFYRKMGFLQIVDTPHYARFESTTGDATFSLDLDENEYSNGSVIYFESHRLEALVEELQDKGIEFEQLPVVQSYLWKEAVLRDPSNNKIKLYWAGEARRHPPWRVELTEEA